VERLDVAAHACERTLKQVETVDTVVIGAGQAGLAASYHLSRIGREHVVLERGRVGERWRSERWDGFVLNTPNWAQRLPGFHYAGDEPDAFAPLAEVIAYLEGYAQSFGSPVREETEVSRVRRADGGFRVETNDGPFAARNVVVAAGAYQSPTASPLTTSLPTDVHQLHTSAYKRPDQLPDGAVLVVGSGQSGCQIAEELLAAGRRVFLSVGRCPWVPRRDRGRELVHWLIETGFADETVDTLPSPAARLTCNPPVSGNDGGHDCNPRWLAARGAVLLGRVTGIAGHTAQIGGGLAESLTFGEEFVSTFRRRVDEYVAAAGLDVPEREPDEDPAPLPEIAELDLRREGITSVLWANGFRPDHSWIDDVGVDGQGWPVHERGVSPVPGLYFVGLHWLNKRKSSLSLGVGEDAEYVVSQLASRKS
jgi:putative flavoprotein involved in K+ transport